MNTKTVAIQLIIFFIFLELGSFLGTRFELFFVNSTPSLYAKNKLPDILRGRTEKHAWGSWHKLNQNYRHSKDCFDVTYSFNEVGARDSSFKDTKKNAILLLGDSFAEGFGVNYEDTSQYILEKKIKRDILNFGTQGIGPLSKLLIYENFREKYAHETVLIYIFPSNDFSDNDKDVWRDIDKTRYRPYYSDGLNPLEPYYFEEAQKRESFDSILGIRSFIKENFWFSNALRSLLFFVRGEASFLEEYKEGTFPLSYYYDAAELQQKNLVKAYQEITKLGNEKKIIFVVIPSQSDILRYKLSNFDKSYENQKWYKAFQELSSDDNEIFFLDLMQSLPSNTDELFFSCDAHWNSYGNIWAADTIEKFMNQAGILDK